VGDYVGAIAASELSIYDEIAVGDPTLWIPAPELESILDQALAGISLAGLPLRTRSKVTKEHVCNALGYPVPIGFKKTQPRFPGQMFDTYVQKSNNLQVWNEELSATRRYVIIRVDSEDVIRRVKVVTGEDLALLDTTGTLTQKYQARLIPKDEEAELIADLDTDRLQPYVRAGINLERAASPVNHPASGMVLPISEVFNRLRGLLGASFRDAGHDQERNRGAALHELVRWCQIFGQGVKLIPT
jgi:hypothetical protein